MAATAASHPFVPALLHFRSGPLPDRLSLLHPGWLIMPDEARSGTINDNGEKPSSPARHPWGRLMAEGLRTAVAGCIGGAFAIGIAWATMQADIKANRTLGTENRELVYAGQRAIKKFERETRDEVAAIKASLDAKHISLRGTFVKQYGLIKDMISKNAAEFGRFAGRMDEAVRWMKEQQRVDSLRMREEWRDWQVRNKN